MSENITDAAREAWNEAFIAYVDGDREDGTSHERAAAQVQRAIDAVTAELRINALAAINAAINYTRKGCHEEADLVRQDFEHSGTTTEMKRIQAKLAEHNQLRAEIAELRRINMADYTEAGWQRAREVEAERDQLRSALASRPSETMYQNTVARAEKAEAEVERLSAPRTVQVDARVLKLEAQVRTLREALPVPDKQGVSFGKCAWVSYDRIVGYEGEDGPDRDAFYANRIIARKILEWANQSRAAIDAARKESAR